MKLIEVVDEFENTKPKNKLENVNHLYRVQKSKCHAIDLFIHQLARQFPDWWKTEGYNFWEDHPTKEWELTPNDHFTLSVRVFSLPKTSIPSPIRTRFRTKYEEMKTAKQAFEDAGGSYPNEELPNYE